MTEQDNPADSSESTPIDLNYENYFLFCQMTGKMGKKNKKFKYQCKLDVAYYQ